VTEEWQARSMREAAERMDRAEDIHFGEVVAAIRAGKHVPGDRLAFLMRTGRPLPVSVRWYIAGRLDGSVTHKGRTTNSLTSVQVDDHVIWTDLDAMWTAQKAEEVREQLREEYRTEHADIRRMRKEQPDEYAALREQYKRHHGSPESIAYAVLAERHGETFDVIRNAVKRKNQRQKIPPLK
jgi:hypothetical protein